MDWTAEQYERAFQQTMIWANIVFYIFLGLMILLCVWWILDKIYQQKYYETLNEDEKSIISKYESVGFFNYRRKVKKVKKDEHN